MNKDEKIRFECLKFIIEHYSDRSFYECLYMGRQMAREVIEGNKTEVNFFCDTGMFADTLDEDDDDYSEWSDENSYDWNAC